MRATRSCRGPGSRRRGRRPLSSSAPRPDVDLTVPEFIRSPGVVRGRSMLTEGPRWFPHRYRLRAPGWDLDLRGEPLVDAPAHALPIEYWTGPVRIEGRACGERAVTGWGFDERSRPWSRGARAGTGAPAHRRACRDARRGAPGTARLPRREVEALALRGDPAAATEHARRHIQPWMSLLDPKAQTLADDLLVALSGRFRTR